MRRKSPSASWWAVWGVGLVRWAVSAGLGTARLEGVGTASVLEGLVRAGVAAVGARYGLLRLPRTVPEVIAVGGEPGGDEALLTVAVQVRGDVLGSFELGGKEGGFGLADEELVRGLAEAMAAVVDEARDEDKFQGAS